jgi:hypothetical protein
VAWHRDERFGALTIGVVLDVVAILLLVRAGPDLYHYGVIIDSVGR